MLDELLRALEPPVVFAPNTEPFWDDDHISKQMLAAHLDPAFSGASRTPGVIDASVAFIAQMIPRRNIPACGTSAAGRAFTPAGWQGWATPPPGWT